MISQIRKLRSFIKKIILSGENKVLTAPDAYDEWAKSYDSDIKNGNLTVFYNDLLVDQLLSKVPLRGKTVCDFGTGTGRYHQKINMHRPKRWIGCDISQGMINKLKEKIPGAEVYKIDDHQLYFLKDNELDVLFSSLTLGYIRQVEETLNEWNRVLKPEGHIVLSVFHPELAHLRTARSFKNRQGELRIIESYRHEKVFLEKLFYDNDWQILNEEEMIIDERAQPVLVKMKKMAMYKELDGKPLVLGYVLCKA